MKKATRRQQAKRKKPARGPYPAAGWEPAPPAPETQEHEDVMELDAWPARRGTAEDERRRIAATFRDMGIGTE